MARQIGPTLPPGFLASKNDEASSDSENDDSVNIIGPSVPAPRLLQQAGPTLPGTSQGAVIGPALPPDYQKDDSDDNEAPAHLKDNDDDDDDDDDDDEFFGPTPSEMSHAGGTNVEEEFERRVKKMKERLDGTEKVNKKPTRESWMTELPSVALTSQLGLAPRQFRTNNAPEITDSDRESWTTVGGHSSQKPEKRQASSELFPEELAKDRKIAKEVKKYNEKMRSESLMDMHSTALKKEEANKDNTAPKERVPFDRERDLNTKKFDDAQRKAILKKAAKLDNRFSHGSKQYL